MIRFGNDPAVSAALRDNRSCRPAIEDSSWEQDFMMVITIPSPLTIPNETILQKLPTP